MKTLQERFDEKWTPVPESGCWLWTAYVMPNGYAQIIKKATTTQQEMADRFGVSRGLIGEIRRGERWRHA